MTNSIESLALRIASRLQTISANGLQVLAEDMAAIACPHMFKDKPPYRQGRTVNGQTSKNWPDAYVLTGANVAHGVEATRDQQSWTRHLDDDLAKNARNKSSGNLHLSGYFFVGGYPDHDPPEADVKSYANRFVAAGIPAENVLLLIGKHLAFELTDPKYARIRQVRLGLPSTPRIFEEIRHSIIRNAGGVLVCPTEEDFSRGLAFKPVIADKVEATLVQDNFCVVLGHGACGKTTLSHWLGMAPRFEDNPVYRVDFARWGDDLPINDICNELTELSGRGVLFIIDNVHIDSGSARVLFAHWRRSCEPLGTRLLMLGRPGFKLETRGTAAAVEMRAGNAEMIGIVDYLLGKAGRPTVAISPDVLDRWQQTFAGQRGGQRAGVDLVAFAAAAANRIAKLALGNLGLTDQDAVDAVRQRYLDPVASDSIRANLQRLAVLAELEFPVPARALPHPSAGFGRELVLGGIVLVANGAFSLAHPALGRLLSVAACIDTPSERLEAARLSSVLAAAMVGRKRFPSERARIIEVLKTSLDTGKWLDSCTRVQDVPAVLSAGVKECGIVAASMDFAIARDSRLITLLAGTRSLETCISVSGHLRRHGFLQTGDRCMDSSIPGLASALEQDLLTATAGRVLAYLKNVQEPSLVCERINRQEWNSRRLGAVLDLGSTTCQLVRYLELVDWPDLAIAPAHHFIQFANDLDLGQSDLGHVSHILRCADADDSDVAQFFERLIASRWLHNAYATTKLGPLCGALMSLANYLASAHRAKLCLPEIDQRITKEAGEARADRLQVMGRFVCLLGAASGLWGTDYRPVKWRWPTGVAIEPTLPVKPGAAGNDGRLGMYELQFWLGLRWLALNDGALPSLKDIALGESFMERLQQSRPRSEFSKNLRVELLDWLRGQASTGWRLH